MAQAPIDQFFAGVKNPVGQGTILSKKPPKPRAPQKPKQPRYKANKPVKQKPAPRLGTQVRAPGRLPGTEVTVNAGGKTSTVLAGSNVKVSKQDLAARRANLKKPPKPDMGPRVTLPTPSGVGRLPSKASNRAALARQSGLSPKDMAQLKRGQAQIAGLTLLPSGEQMNLAAHDILNIPGGIYHAAAAPVQDIAAGDITFPHTRAVAKGVYEGTKYSLTHGSKDPFGFALAVGSLAAPAARLGEVGEALSTGGVRAAARAAVNRGPQATASRSLSLGDFKTEGLYSRNSAARYAQRAHDALIQKAAKEAPAGRAGQYLAGRIGREERKNRLVREAIQRAPAAVLTRHHLTTPQQAALRAYAENTTSEARVAFHKTAAKAAEAAPGKARHRAHAAFSGMAGKYLTVDEHGNVQFAATKQGRKLAGVYQEMETAAHNRERLMTELGYTPTEHRVNAPGEIIRGEVNGNLGRIRVPYTSRRPVRALAGHGRVGTSGVVAAEARVPGSFTHEYTGGLLKSGKFRTATTRVAAESNLEAQRYHALTTQLARYHAAVHEHPLEGDIPVRLKPKLSPAARDLLQKADEGIQLTKQERAALGKDWETFHKQAFPDHLTPDEIKPGEIGYINQKLLGQLNKNPGRGKWPVWDAANSIAKVGLIYGKPGYIPANLLGNIALAVSQQGLAVLKNLPRAATMGHRLGSGYSSVIDHLMGAGVSRSIVGDESQMLEHAVGKVADIVSTPTDRFTRRASFDYEAKRAGFRTPAQQVKLLSDPANEGKLLAVVRRARENAIEYENLTPVEKSYLRKLVFIYPWVKGSTTYAGRFLRDHPHQSNILYQLGAQGNELANQELGSRPSYMQGIFKVGGTTENPLTVNPAAMANFSTPAQLLDMGRGILTGQMTKQDLPIGMLSPIAQMAAAGAIGVNPNTGGPVKPLDVLPQFAATLPQVTFAQSMMGKQPGSGAIYQRGKGEAAGKFGVGSIYPATTSRKNLNRVAANEAKANWSPQRKAKFTMQQQLAAYITTMKQSGVHEAFVGGKLGPSQRKAWQHQAKLKIEIANLPHYHNPTFAQKVDYQKRKVALAVDLAVSVGNWDEQTTGTSAAAFKKAIQGEKQIQKLRSAYSWISKNLLGGGVLAAWRSYARTKNPNAFR